MKRPYKFLLASLLCAAPLGALLPGCGGGGGSSSTPSQSLFRQLGVQFDADSPIRANLRVQFDDGTASSRKAVGILQIVSSTATGQARQSNATSDPIRVFPEPATYITKGTIDDPTGNATLNLSGNFGNQPFTITGNFFEGSTIEIRSQYKSGLSILTGTLTAPVAIPTATPIRTLTPLPTSGTPVATGTAIATTVPTATGFPTATTVPTATTFPTTAAGAPAPVP